VAFEDQPAIVALRIRPQWITAYELLKDTGFFAVEKVSGHVRVKEEVLVVIMGQLKFIPEERFSDNSNPVPTDQRAQDLHEARLSPPCISG
jgi:hypothetical protein